tara:strand:- start:1185 stop:1376 length:192 start_codon:yes stop_codon:yes gene_type:complete
MIKIKTSILSKAIKSKKDFLFFDTNENNIVSNYILTNDFKRRKEFKFFRVISTIQKELEFIVI